mgnify:CR=1 FL=1
MTRRILIVPVLLAMGVTAAGAQTTFEAPRLPDGQPDLQGVWDFRTLTPLQRPEDQADKLVLTTEEAAEVESQAAARTAAANAPSEVRTEPLPVGGNIGAYNSYWVDQGARIVGDQRTSLIVDTPDGRLPALQPGIELDVLSLGEQQRIAMARLYYHEPAVALLDESTSALGPEWAERFYQRLREKRITVISIGHNLELVKLHDRMLYLDGSGSYEVKKIEE